MAIRRRKTRRMRGGSVPDAVSTTAKNSAYQILRRPTRSNIFGRLADIHQGLRNNKTISRFLTTKGWGRLGSVASMLGYGKRRTVRRRRLTGGRKRRTTRRRMTGRGFFGDVWGGIKNVGRALAPTVANLAVKRLTGGGRRSRVGRPRTTGRRMQRGRGIFGKIAGGLLGSILPF